MLSRVADNLYWMSRYLERAEHTARLIDANLVLMLDQSPGAGSQRWGRLFASLGAAPPAEGGDNARAITQALTFDRANHSSIVSCVGAARDNARQVREQISTEMWEQLNRFYLQMSRAGIDEIWNGETHTFFREVKEGAHLFLGITEATMSRGEGWHFMQLGRFIERAGATTALLDTHFSAFLEAQSRGGETNAYLDWVGFLKSRTAFEAYCQVYTADLQPVRIAEFLLLNTEFPYTVRFAAGMIKAALQAIARLTSTRDDGQAERLAGRLRATLDYAQIDEIMAAGLHTYLEHIQSQCAQIHATIHKRYITPSLETVFGA
jgi:uncharacterized alpha-E superfamily protein